LPTSIKIGGSEYDVIAFSEEKQEILLLETKFKDPSPSSFSAKKLIEQEFTTDKYGLLPQVKKHQERYDLLAQQGKLFQRRLGLQNAIQRYGTWACFVTKYTPLISRYRNVSVISDKDFMKTVLV